MIRYLKKALKHAIGPERIGKFRMYRNYIFWILKGKPVPAEGIYKWKVLKTLGKQHGIRTFVETGTAGGGTVRELEGRFDALYTIELDPILYKEGVAKSPGSTKIHFLEGDSGIVLKKVLNRLSSPALFWLDAHYSGTGTARAALDTPVVQEILSIFSHPNKRHIIVIDDMREFNGTHDYSTLHDLEAIIRERGPEYLSRRDNDLMIIEPKRS